MKIFFRRINNDCVYCSKRELKTIDFNFQLFVKEVPSPLTQTIFLEARAKLKNKFIKEAWAMNGSVYVKLHSDEAFSITSLQQLNIFQ